MITEEKCSCGICSQEQHKGFKCPHYIRNRTICSRCGHPKRKGQYLCDHCEEAVDFLLNGRKNDKYNHTGVQRTEIPQQDNR